jgi:HEAT repeat protein
MTLRSKRLAARTGIGLLLLLPLAACGGSGEETPSPVEPATPAPATPAPATAPASPPVEPTPRLDDAQEAQARQWIAELDASELDRGFEAAERLAGLGPAVIPVVGPLLRTEAPERTRWHAARILGKVGSPRAVRYLHDGMKDAWLSVRIESAESLARVMEPDDEVSMTELISILLNDTEPIVQAYTARAMIGIGNLMGIPTLVANLQKKLWPRETSRDALRAYSGEDFGFDPYAPEADRREAAAKWNDWYKDHLPLQRNLIEYLGVYKFLFAETAKNILLDLGSHAVPTVVEALDHPNEHVRAHCAEILGILAEPSAVEPLVRRLDDEEGVVRLQAAIALGKIARPEAVEALARSASEDLDRDVRYASVVALGRIATAGTVAALEHVALRTEETVEVRDLARLFLMFGPAGADFRCESAGILLRRGNPLGVPAVVVRLGESAAEAEAARSWLHEHLPEALAPAPSDGEEAPRSSVATWCESWLVGRAPAVRERLVAIETVLRESPESERAARWARLFVPAIAAALLDETSTEHDRFRAAEILGTIGDDRASGSLGKALREDPSMMVREAAAHALRKIGDPRSARDLEAALSDRERYVRLAAVKALATSGDADSRPPLMQAARDNYLDSEIVGEVGQAIREIHRRRFSDEEGTPAPSDRDTGREAAGPGRTR